MYKKYYKLSYPESFFNFINNKKHKGGIKIPEKNTAAKMTAAQAKEKVIELENKLEEFKSYAYCPMCDSHKKRENFYVSTDPLIKGEVSFICKRCARKLAVSVNKNGEEIVTKDSMILALKYLDKPFLNSVWDASVQESENLLAGRTKSTPYDSYVKNIAMGQYSGYTYSNSDFFKNGYCSEKAGKPRKKNTSVNKESLETYKKDVIKLLGYDPFENEVMSDRIFLYSQLLGMLDAGGYENDDMVRNSSCISIVRGFLQSSKIDAAITALMPDIKNIEKNSASIKSLQESKQKITSMIINLAAESCISLKNNKNAKKGENTWTGKIKKIKDLDLRQGRVNGFDMETCKAMRQVMDASHHSIIQELKLDESDWSDMVAEQRNMIIELQAKLDKYIEISRILLNENLDLKDFIKDNNIDLKCYSYTDLENLYSDFACDNEEEEEISDEDD